ncbi:DUF4405 domain-containing protein [Hansschlegelia beijingensis]|uniref:DUF4405 domain-containing protein n=1 Tax=Hansschlegelia beijingensis TaxID=1133344 RepID=A0A7W6D0V6_9HYPH|nr:DUF4405 domain-containing protein [Hansschlegelia beijingensis]MBB3973942.1 hypothetical protein [Hansschlegelia beijingensis]
MKTLIHRYGTPLTTGLFLVSAVSGVALFFRWQPAAFHLMHEWLSLALLVPFGLHLWKNWKPMVGYLKRKTLIIPLLASILVAVPFAVNGMMKSRGGSPGFRAMSVLTKAQLSDLAPILKASPEDLVARLRADGHKVDTAEATLEGVAASSGVRASELLFKLMPQRPATP